MTVDDRIMQLVLAQKPSRKTEVLEIAFSQAVEKRTLNVVRAYEHSPWAHQTDLLPTTTDADDDEEFERPIELAKDDRDGPEVLVIQLIEEARQTQSLQTAYAAVKDPMDLRVVKLHFEEGLPISSTDPHKRTVVTETGESRGQVNYRMSTSLKQMRKALGVKK
jgi:hypothetical protein